MNMTMYEEIPPDFIFCFYDSFSDTLCDRIISFIEEHHHSFIEEHHRRALDRQNVYVNCDAFHQLLQNFHQDTEAEILEAMVFAAYSSILQNISEISPIDIPVAVDSGYNLRKFEAGQKTRFHMDGLDVNQESARSLTVITYLNDDFGGGELVFPNQSKIIAPKKGMTIVFPPFWTHPHHANPVDAPRYTVNTWFKETHRGIVLPSVDGISE